MVSYARYGEPPPQELQTAWALQRWNALPEAGGYYDQEYSLMTRMSSALNISEAVVKFRSRKGKEIHNAGLGERRIIRWLKENGFYG